MNSTSRRSLQKLVGKIENDFDLVLQEGAGGHHRGEQGFRPRLGHSSLAKAAAR